MSIHIYKIDLDYIKYLYYNYDSKVLYNENESDSYNEKRPYIGILLNVLGKDYYAPLEHPRPKHKNLKNNPHIIKIENGKYGILSLNNMIPIHKNLLVNFDINTDPNKKILLAQFIYCDNNKTDICNNALTVYKKRTEKTK